MRLTKLPFLCLAFWPGSALAEISFEFPGSVIETHRSEVDFASYKLPIGPYGDGFIPTLVAEGPKETRAWRIQILEPSSLAVMDSLRQQLEKDGFELLFECETKACGGFDFRFGTDVLPEPDMHIDLGDFRYLAAQRLGGAIPEYVSLFVSRSPAQAHVQLTSIGSDVVVAPTTNLTVSDETSISQNTPLLEALISEGHIVLNDLAFQTGSSELDDKDYPSLKILTEFLSKDSSRVIALVGHTDAVGTLANNVALSRKRAQSVAKRLVANGAGQNQVVADGVGYLAPVATNETEAGRAKNRRVEAVLISISER